MNCTNETYLDNLDFDCIGIVAKHCDLSKLCIGIDEAKTFDIIPLFCFDFVNDVLENWNLLEDNQDYQKYKDLICGGTYEVSGKTHFNMGFKKVWVYYSYARYLLLNQMNDTANGTVTKQNDWSVPTPLKDVTAFSNKYRDMGKEAYHSLLGYLCNNKDIFTKFDGKNCKLSCGCSGNCECRNKKKITGFKFSTIKK